MFRHVPRLLGLRVHWCAFGCAVTGLSLLLSLDSVQGHDSGKEDIGKLSEFAYAKTVTVALGGGVKMEFVLIPQGRFQMGSPKDENGHCDDEQLHEVSITRPFYLGPLHGNSWAVPPVRGRHRTQNGRRAGRPGRLWV